MCGVLWGTMEAGVLWGTMEGGGGALRQKGGEQYDKVARNRWAVEFDGCRRRVVG